jgi:hypothetical protein
MKYVLLSVLVLFMFATIGSKVANAQRTQRVSATPKTFQAFYAKFRKAVIARDKVTVASLTRFPFDYGFDAGDEGTYTRRQFLKNFNNIFGTDAEAIAFFRRANPTVYPNGRKFDVLDDSDASHYIFEKRGASYQFTAYIVEP